MDFPSIAEQADRPYISTGHLPEPEWVQRLVSEAHRRFKSNGDGYTHKSIRRSPGFRESCSGFCVVGTRGRVDEAGDTEL